MVTEGSVVCPLFPSIYLSSWSKSKERERKGQKFHQSRDVCVFSACKGAGFLSAFNLFHELFLGEDTSLYVQCNGAHECMGDCTLVVRPPPASRSHASTYISLGYLTVAPTHRARERESRW